MANLDVAEAFYAEGGTEFAPMSTTSSLEVWEIGRSPADHQQPRGLGDREITSRSPAASRSGR